VCARAVRPGTFAGQALKGYRQEEAVDPASNTETYVAVRLHVDTWRWSGVPFYLRTGKRLPKRLTEVAIQFRSPPMAMFAEAEQIPDAVNQLVLRVQPDEESRCRSRPRCRGCECAFGR